MKLFRLTTNIEEMDAFDMVAADFNTIVSLMTMCNTLYSASYPSLRLVVQAFEGSEMEMFQSMRVLADVGEHFMHVRNKMIGLE